MAGIHAITMGLYMEMSGLHKKQKNYTNENHGITHVEMTRLPRKLWHCTCENGRNASVKMAGIHL